MPLDPALYRPHSLPRLDPTCYQADAAVLWTLTTFDREKLPLTDEFLHSFRELLLHTMVREHLLAPIYIIMPDHIHIMWVGTHIDSDQNNAMRFFRTYLARLIKPARLQPQPHDHVFTEKERRKNAFARACQYVALNSLRANLVAKPNDWKFCGALLPGYPQLDPFDPTYWQTFWKIFAKLRGPDCDRHIPIRRLLSNL